MLFRMLFMGALVLSSLFGVDNTWSIPNTVSSPIPSNKATSCALGLADDGETAICLYADGGTNFLYTAATITHGLLWKISPVIFTGQDGSVAISGDGKDVLSAYVNAGNLIAQWSTDLGDIIESCV